MSDTSEPEPNFDDPLEFEQGPPEPVESPVVAAAVVVEREEDEDDDLFGDGDEGDSAQDDATTTKARGEDEDEKIPMKEDVDVDMDIEDDEDDGLSDDERERRRRLEYNEDEDDDQGGDDVVIKQLQEVSMEIHRWNQLKSSNNTTHLLKLPPFVSLDSKPFDFDTYQEETTVFGEEQPEASAIASAEGIMLKVENTLRWKWIKDDKTGEMIKASNAKYIRWSDGSLSLQLGSSLFDVASSAPLTIPSSETALSTTSSSTLPNSFLISHHNESQILQVEQPINTLMSLIPADNNTKMHREWARVVQQRHDKKGRLKVFDDSTFEKPTEASLKRLKSWKGARGAGGSDSEDDYDVIERKERRKRRGGPGAGRSGGRKAAASDEDDSEYDEERYAAPRAGEKRNRPRAASRRDIDAELSDDFVIDDSDEEDGTAKKSPSKKRRKDDDEVSLDSIDAAEARIEAAERKSKKVSPSKKASASKKKEESEEEEEEESEEEMESEEEEEDLQVTKKKRIVVEDEEDE